MSQMWANTYKASLMNTEKFQDYNFKEKKDYDLFKFGPSQVYTSMRSMTIPIILGDEVKEVEVSVVHANIPFTFSSSQTSAQGTQGGKSLSPNNPRKS